MQRTRIETRGADSQRSADLRFHALRTRGALVVRLFVATILVLAASPAAGQDLKSLGSFDNVRGTESGHCYGYSLELWQHGKQIMGLLDVHEGLCGDPPCGVLQEVTFDRGTGRLHFRSTAGSEYRFEGVLRRDDVFGRLNGQSVRLGRNRNRTDIVSDRSLAQWCEFWTPVARCGGVREFCKSHGALK